MYERHTMLILVAIRFLLSNWEEEFEEQLNMTEGDVIDCYERIKRDRLSKAEWMKSYNPDLLEIEV